MANILIGAVSRWNFPSEFGQRRAVYLYLSGRCKEVGNDKRNEKEAKKPKSKKTKNIKKQESLMKVGRGSLRVIGWDGFELLVIWPVAELIPVGVEDPLFNWFCLIFWGIFVVNIHFGMNPPIRVSTTGKKTQKT